MALPVALSSALAAPPSAPAADPLDPAVHARLEQALSYVNLATSDLGWDKRPVQDGFRLSVVNLALDRPLSLAPTAARAEADFASDPASSARAAAAWLDLTAAAAPPLDAPTLPERFTGVPGEAQEILALLVNARRTAEGARLQSLRALSPAERALLARDSARIYTDEREDDDYDAHPLLAAAAKIDRSSLVAAAVTLADAAAAVRARARELHPESWPSRSWTVDGIR